MRCASCGGDGHHAERCPYDHLTPLREALDENLRFFEGKPDTFDVSPGVFLRLDQWRHIREALAHA